MLLKLAVLGLAGLVGYRLLAGRGKDGNDANAAFAEDQPQESDTAVRDAGPKAMRDGEPEEWSKVDEALDESFPASDPPAF